MNSFSCNVDSFLSATKGAMSYPFLSQSKWTIKLYLNNSDVQHGFLHRLLQAISNQNERYSFIFLTVASLQQSVNITAEISWVLHTLSSFMG